METYWVRLATSKEHMGWSALAICWPSEASQKATAATTIAALRTNQTEPR
jgi:hypothetical protein